MLLTLQTRSWNTFPWIWHSLPHILELWTMSCKHKWKRTSEIHSYQPYPQDSSCFFYTYQHRMFCAKSSHTKTVSVIWVIRKQTKKKKHACARWSSATPSAYIKSLIRFFFYLKLACRVKQCAWYITVIPLICFENKQGAWNVFDVWSLLSVVSAIFWLTIWAQYISSFLLIPS